MPKALKRNAVIVFGLAALFYWSFMVAKHDPALREIIPFGEDPYDAVGSFGVIVGMLIALLSLVRAFRPYREHPPSTAQRVYLVRSQMAVVLAVLITLAADLVAMARNPRMWIGAASWGWLIALLGGMVVVTVAVQLLIHASQEKLPEGGMQHWTAAAIATLMAILVLALYPEQLINHTATHLLTVVAGDIVLFAPMRPLLNALVPYKADQGRIETTPARRRFSTAAQRWGIVLVVGGLVGAVAFLGEMSEGWWRTANEPLGACCLRVYQPWARRPSHRLRILGKTAGTGAALSGPICHSRSSAHDVAAVDRDRLAGNVAGG